MDRHGTLFSRDVLHRGQQQLDGHARDHRHALHVLDDRHQLRLRRALDQQLLLLYRRLRHPVIDGRCLAAIDRDLRIVRDQFDAGITGTTIVGHAIEIQDTDLNLNSSFTCVARSPAQRASTTVTVWAECKPAFGGNFAELPSALT